VQNTCLICISRVECGRDVFASLFNST